MNRFGFDAKQISQLKIKQKRKSKDLEHFQFPLIIRWNEILFGFPIKTRTAHIRTHVLINPIYTMKHRILFWTNHLVILVIGILIANSLFGSANPNWLTIYPISTNDSIRSTLLKEVIVYSNRGEANFSENPRIKNNYHVDITESFEIGLLVNDKQLIGKKLQNISIHFDRKLTDGYKFQVLIYSTESDGIPKTVLNNKVLHYSKGHANWNTYYLNHEEIEIPESGLYIMVHFLEKSTPSESKSKINMGQYRSPRQFYMRPTGSHDWFAMKSFKKSTIGPMIRISVID